MPAPTKHPDWATDGTNTVEPPAGKVAAGWLPAEQPPAGWFNWWQHLVGLWTRWLEERIDALESGTGDLAGDAALKSQTNTFTKSQIINSEAAAADAPLLSTQGKPGDHAGSASNRWKLVFAFPSQDDAWSGLFVGRLNDGYALVTNARWHVGAQEWRQLDTDYQSTALVGQAGNYAVSIKAAGSSSGWTDWPTTGGGDIKAAGHARVAGDYLYGAPKTHLTYKSIFTGAFGDGQYVYAGTPAIPFVRLALGGDQHYWPLNLPHNAKLRKVEVSVAKAGTATIVGWVFARNAKDTFGTSVPVDLQLGTGNSAASGVVNLVIDCDPAGPDEPPTVDLGLLDYYVKIKASTDGAEDVYAIRVTWDEPGLNCYAG